MTDPPIRAVYGMWPMLDQRLREAIADLTPEQLATAASPANRPLWAIVGHLACQRVFGLCDLAGEPGGADTPFPDAGSFCPGDEDFTPRDAAQLVVDLEQTFRIVDRVLDTWTVGSLDQRLRSPAGEPAQTRGGIIQRTYTHDVYHASEASIALGILGRPALDLW